MSCGLTHGLFRTRSGNTTSSISVKDLPEATFGAMSLAASLNLQPALELVSLQVGSRI